MTNPGKLQNNLATVNPELAKQWHPTKNGELTPLDVTAGSNKEVWWICDNGHEWSSKISNRVINGTGCPYCSGRYPIKGITDLATTNPELARQWHPTKNGNLKPTDVKEHSNKKVWWVCEKGHEWQAIVSSRTNGRGCPYCSGKAVLIGYNDLSTIRPDLVKQWHPTKNKLQPEQVSKGYDKKVWWICEFGHEWQAPVYSRFSDHGCPICAKGQKTSFSEQTIFYYIRKAYPDAKNSDNEFGVEFDIYIPSLLIAIEYDGYKWHSDERTIRKDNEKNSLCLNKGITLIRFREEGCPILEYNPSVKYISCKYNDINRLEDAVKELLFILNVEEKDVNINRDRLNILSQFASARKGKSLAECNPELAKEWHPTKNGQLTPKSINIGSDEKYWWRGTCGHEWQASVANRTKGKGCPICNGKKVQTGFNDLATAYPIIAKQWHPTQNGELRPNSISPHSNKKVWWVCERGHEWQAIVSSRTNGRGCPYCSGKAVLIGYNDLATTRPNLAKEWHTTKNGSLTPQMFSKGSHKKVWWICEFGHEWQADINSRARGRGCPQCAKKKRSNKE